MRNTIHTAILGIAITAGIVQASVVQPEKRDLPVDHGCIPCKGGDGPYYQAAQEAFRHVDPQLIEEGRASFSQTFEKGYQPKLCAAESINCVTAGPGVTWTGNKQKQGLTDPVGRWRRKDGTETIAWPYWQSTLQWTCTGGSGTTYNAHCTIFTCAKGTMRADIWTGGSVQGDGQGDNDAKNVCGCFPNNYLNTDITFTQMGGDSQSQGLGSDLGVSDLLANPNDERDGMARNLAQDNAMADRGGGGGMLDSRNGKESEGGLGSMLSVILRRGQ